MRRWKIAAATAAAVTAAAIGAAPLVGPASAHDQGAYGPTFADGGGSLWDDFGDHYGEIGNSLCNGCGSSWNTDTVVLWQALLAAEGLLSHSAIDGRFGSGTATATKKFQSRYGLTADGKVGPATWGKADSRLRWDSCGCYVYYDGYGSTGRLTLTRGNPWAGYDGGAYDLESLRDDDDAHVTYFTDTHHIYHKSRTVTVDNWR